MLLSQHSRDVPLLSHPSRHPPPPQIEVSDPAYKMLTQPSVLQLALTAGNDDVTKVLLSYFESPMAVRLDELFEDKRECFGGF